MKGLKKTLLYLLCVMALVSCTSDLHLSEEIPSDPDRIIRIGGLATDEGVTLTTRAEDPDTVRAETLPWLQGALRKGLDIIYSNLNEDGSHNLGNESVALLTWTGEVRGTDPDKRGVYTFRYKGTTNDAEWYDNGPHYFEGQYVPEEIRTTGEGITAQDLTIDQHDDRDHTYDANGDASGYAGNYTLLSHYIGMPPNWTTSATIEQILLPFKHRLARVIAYVLIDDALESTLDGYTFERNDDGTVKTKEDPTTTKIRFCNVNVLDKVLETPGDDTRAATLTPTWKEARKVIPHFMDEYNSSRDSKDRLVANDFDAENFFIVYISKRDEKVKVHPRDGKDWLKVHKAFRKNAGLLETSTEAVPENMITKAEECGYTRKMYHRVPIYDIIVRPTYKTVDDVMYDEAGYYDENKLPVESTIQTLAQAKNSIDFEMELKSGLVYEKEFEFDLNANQQTVVYLTIDRESIDYDDSSSEPWITTDEPDGYYGVDNDLGHNMSLTGSSWQRAIRNSSHNHSVTDGNKYDETQIPPSDKVGEFPNDDQGQYVTDARWIEEFAKAYKDGERHGDYFVLDKNITIDATLLPKGFVFTGHLDGRGNTITLTNTDGQNAYKPAAPETSTTADLYEKTVSGFIKYRIPQLYIRVMYQDSELVTIDGITYVKETLTDNGDGTYNINDKSIVAPDNKIKSYESAVIPATIANLKVGEYYTDNHSGVRFVCPSLYVFSHTSVSYLFAGLNGTYDAAVGEANVHSESVNSSNLVPVKGYRAELMNVNLAGGTFFPADAIFTGTNLTLDGANVSGYVFNCWELDADPDKLITNEVPIPHY